MCKLKLFLLEASRELMCWAIIGLTLTLEYVFYTRFRELSPSDILQAYRACTTYTPPPILESGLLCMLFLLMAATGIVFVIFTHKLGIKFYNWLEQTR